ncbi:hypothetical protein D7X30_18255 [Corallococcus sp. AB011P]|uniref:hypothetical protein n=1 Tax=Corallococcus sp. AB011P TaxID=2316735 RepID=UPI000EA07C84|nr:hypothetical protein [Corallococcus sp. AB011P]RKG57462.1 hypothetical protein D7X30_18255 [Corallococcus sp. AB011P]
MTRSDQRRGHAWGVLFLGLAVAWATGCKKEQPVESAPVDAGVVAVDAGLPDAGSVAQGARPLRFSNVGLQRVEDGDVTVTYTLTNPGTAQGREKVCLMLLDAHDLAIEVRWLGSITVKGGLEDTFEDQTHVDDLQWNQVRSLRLFTTASNDYCSDTPLKPASEPFRMLPTGAPVPADLSLPDPPPESAPEDFEVSGLQLRQTGTPAGPSLTFTVKNVSDHRASGSGCLRAYAQEGSRALEEVDAGEFDLAPKASSTQTVAVTFHRARHWEEATVLRYFVGPHGCVMSEGVGGPGHPVTLPVKAGSEEVQHDAE